MKSCKHFVVILNSLLCLMILNTSYADNAPFNIKTATTTSSSDIPDECESTAITPYRTTFVCFDTQPRGLSKVSEQFRCIVNPNNSNVASAIKKYCNGTMHHIGGTPSTFIMLPITDGNNPTGYYVTYLQINIGKCSTIFQSNDLSYLAGNIYTCNQSTGTFSEHQ